jgi:putative transposase
MDEKQERDVRHQAMRRLLRGEGPTAIAQVLKRSRQWLNKWWHRFLNERWSGLRSHSRRPRHSPERYDSRIRRQVKRARRVLEQAAVGLIGTPSVREQLRAWRVKPLPSLATIGRILKAEGLTHPRHPTPAPRAYYPHPRATATYRLQAIDWTAHWVRGGEPVYAFTAVNYASHDLCSQAHADKSAATACTFALHVWSGFLGLPDGLQIDNDSAFSGGRRGLRVFSRFVRLCLYLGIEPIFIPFYEPERNELVEHCNGLWQRTFWKRRRFRSLKHVQRRTPEFEHWYRYVYKPPSLQGKTTAQVSRSEQRVRLSAEQIRCMPARLPITTGRVHFLRLVDEAGDIVILNERWRVGRRHAPVGLPE